NRSPGRRGRGRSITSSLSSLRSDCRPDGTPAVQARLSERSTDRQLEAAGTLIAIAATGQLIFACIQPQLQLCVGAAGAVVILFLQSLPFEAEHGIELGGAEGDPIMPGLADGQHAGDRAARGQPTDAAFTGSNVAFEHLRLAEFGLQGEHAFPVAVAVGLDPVGTRLDHGADKGIHTATAVIVTDVGTRSAQLQHAVQLTGGDAQAQQSALLHGQGVGLGLAHHHAGVLLTQGQLGAIGEVDALRQLPGLDAEAVDTLISRVDAARDQLVAAFLQGGQQPRIGAAAAVIIGLVDALAAQLEHGVELAGTQHYFIRPALADLEGIAVAAAAGLGLQLAEDVRPGFQLAAIDRFGCVQLQAEGTEVPGAARTDRQTVDAVLSRLQEQLLGSRAVDQLIVAGQQGEFRLVQAVAAGDPIQGDALELQTGARVAGAVFEIDRTLAGQLTGKGWWDVLDRGAGSSSTRFVTAGQENRHACQRQGYRTMGDAHEESFFMLVSREACPEHHRSTSQPTDYITNCFP